jgi:hypothetical protein
MIRGTCFLFTIFTYSLDPSNYFIKVPNNQIFIKWECRESEAFSPNMAFSPTNQGPTLVQMNKPPWTFFLNNYSKVLLRSRLGVSLIECSLCIEEAGALRKRRRCEDVDVMTLDSSSISEGEFWYLIGSSWLKLWQDFKSAGPPPGAISNNRLFRASSGGKSAEKLEVRTNLIRGEHYRGINEKVCNYLYNIYGGGPVLKRPSIDIYKE